MGMGSLRPCLDCRTGLCCARSKHGTRKPRAGLAEGLHDEHVMSSRRHHPPALAACAGMADNPTGALQARASSVRNCVKHLLRCKGAQRRLTEGGSPLLRGQAFSVDGGSPRWKHQSIANEPLVRRSPPASQGPRRCTAPMRFLPCCADRSAGRFTQPARAFCSRPGSPSRLLPLLCMHWRVTRVAVQLMFITPRQCRIRIL